jgi:hypothetical protein
MEPVTIFTTFSVAEAQLIRSRLEAAGFTAAVTHETASLTTEGYSMTTGGVKVQVPAEEALDARELLDAENEGEQEQS